MAKAVARGEVPDLPVRVDRSVPPPALQPFTDYFMGFEKVEAVRKVFGEETSEVLSRLKIGFISNRRMYMGIRDHDGNVAVGTYHLRHSATRVLYLDIIHELFHIKQWMRDKEWFTREHEKFMGDAKLYYSSPLEVPAYEHTVREAERLGMTREEIVEYLKMLPVSRKTWERFLDALKISPRSRPLGEAKRLPVRIKREPKLVLYPFTDYFAGFEDAEPVRALFGRRAKESLGAVKVEFLESPFRSIFPSEEDGHLVVNTDFVKNAELEAIYLDVVLSLNHLMLAKEAGPDPPGKQEFGRSQAVLGAYRAMVKEAKRIGTEEGKVRERLQLPRFMMSDSEFREFVAAIGLRPRAGSR